MNLYLSYYSPMHSVYTHESGQVLYKVETPITLGSRISTIRRVIHNKSMRMKSLGMADPTSKEAVKAAVRDGDLQDQFEVLAQVQHNLVDSSILKFGGQEIETKAYFRKEGWGAYGHNRVFTGPDGREYKWHLNTSTCKLSLNDSSKTPVAKFHTKSFGIIGKARPARLEIFEEGMNIIETIMMTFIYIEKIRKDRERRSRWMA